MVFIDSLRIQHRCENTYNSVDWVVCPVRFPSHTIRHTAFPYNLNLVYANVYSKQKHVILLEMEPQQHLDLVQCAGLLNTAESMAVAVYKKGYKNAFAARECALCGWVEWLSESVCKNRHIRRLAAWNTILIKCVSDKHTYTHMDIRLILSCSISLGLCAVDISLS